MAALLDNYILWVMKNKIVAIMAHMAQRNPAILVFFMISKTTAGMAKANAPTPSHGLIIKPSITIHNGANNQNKRIQTMACIFPNPLYFHWMLMNVIFDFGYFALIFPLTTCMFLQSTYRCSFILVTDVCPLSCLVNSAIAAY